jgi:hypothetical protein
MINGEITIYSVVDRINFILPSFNEGKNIQHTLNLLSSINKKIIQSVIIVDDHSQKKIEIKDLKKNKKIKNLIILRNKINSGKAISLKNGLNHLNLSKNDKVIFLDIDGQYSKSTIERLIKLLNEGNDYVFPIRKKRSVPFRRRIFSNLHNATISKILNIPTVDFFVGLKGFSFLASEKLKTTNINMRYSHYILTICSFKQKSFDIREKERMFGRSSYNHINLINLAIKDILYALKLRLVSNNEKKN